MGARWAALFAALHTHDAPGALILGEPSTTSPSAWLLETLTQSDALFAELGSRSADVAGTLLAGSYAGGKQPKFLAQLADGSHVLVKFTPPRGTLFGERWRELLLAEALATLQAHDMPCADIWLPHSPTRTYLLSRRFDRVGTHGRRHVVAIGTVHESRLSDSYQHWAHNGHQLHNRQQLGLSDARQIETAIHFGRLVGNTDMRSGNLSPLVKHDTWKRPRFRLTSIYNMLPMRWLPEATMSVPDYSTFDLHPLSAQSPAWPVAQAFWRAMGNSVWR
jgi:HipA-like C-terminal domain